MPSTEEVSSENVLHSDAKSIGKIVEVDTIQLEKYLCGIQETLAKHELSIKLIPITNRKLDLCVLDVDILRDRFFQSEKAATQTTLLVRKIK